MAGLYGVAVTANIAVAASTTLTVLQLVAPANQRLRVVSPWASFSGVVAADAPIQVQIVYQSTAGTMSALTIVKNNPGQAETLQATAQHTATVEPTLVSVSWNIYVPPTMGYEKLVPLGDEYWVDGGDRIAIRVISGTPLTTVNGIFGLRYEE